MLNPHWTNRLCTAGDKETVFDLVQTVYPNTSRGAFESWWRWWYLSDISCRREIVVAMSNERAIGIRGMMIVDFQWGPNRLRGAVHLGLITHPSQRRRGVFRSLVASSNEYLFQWGVHFSISMPNDRSVRAYSKWNDWHYGGLIPLYVKVADGMAMFRSKTRRLAGQLMGRRRRSLLDRVALHAPTHGPSAPTPELLPEEFDGISEDFARDCGVLMLRRSASYWNWRYGKKPNADYRTIVAQQDSRPVGAVVVSMQERSGFEIGMVLDLVARGGIPTVRQLLRSAEGELVSRDVGLIACQATSPMLERALRDEGYWRMGPLLSRKRFHFVYRMTGVPGLPRHPARLTDWHITLGDSDNT